MKRTLVTCVCDRCGNPLDEATHDRNAVNGSLSTVPPNGSAKHCVCSFDLHWCDACAAAFLRFSQRYEETEHGWAFKPQVGSGT